ncbi:MAG: helix-turn-helix transcriptional regulator [Lachnospiraceae bacterium]|nr:helix-turn-helix transcriptional regulator [Lachnospiraceae bacterium]
MSKTNKYPSSENHNLFLDTGKHIAFYRQRAGMTQTQLAAAVGVSRTYISRIESQNQVQAFSMELLFDISKALDIPVHLLFMPLKGGRKRKNQ